MGAAVPVKRPMDLLLNLWNNLTPQTVHIWHLAFGFLGTSRPSASLHSNPPWWMSLHLTSPSVTEFKSHDRLIHFFAADSEFVVRLLDGRLDDPDGPAECLPVYGWCCVPLLKGENITVSFGYFDLWHFLTVWLIRYDICTGCPICSWTWVGLTILPSCLADSAQFPSALAEFCRQWNTIESTQPGPWADGTPCTITYCSEHFQSLER